MKKLISLLIFIAALYGSHEAKAQSSTPAAAGQCNLTDGFGGWVLGSCGSGGLPTGFTANTSTGIFTVPNGFATSNQTQGYLVLQQNSTAAPSQPANSYELLAPQSGLTSSYSNVVPLTAPTLANSVQVSPSGGGQETWLGIGQVRIATSVLGSVTNTITFASIPQTFTHLKLEIYGQDSAGVNGVDLTFNGDTAAHYYYVNTINNSGTLSGATGAATSFVLIGALSLGGSNSIVVDIPGYTSAFPKGVISSNQITDASNSNFYSQNVSGGWTSAAAITSMTIALSGGNFNVGTSFTLYGLP